jgi:kynurenine formamidase
MKPIDLTLTISEKLPSFPGSPLPQFIPWSKIKTDGYNLELLFLSSHSGTHMDAPFHFIKNGLKIHQIEVDRLVRDALLIKIRKGINQSITKNEIIQFEKKHGKIPNDATIIIATGWYKNLEKKSYFEKNPGLSSSAADYLSSKKINLVGIDSPSIDVGSDKEFTVHKILSKNNIIIVENLSNLEKIHNSKFKFIALPLKLRDATGSPIRAIAV